MAIKTDGMTVKELYEERADLIAESRKLIDTAESEKRDLSDEETRKFDEMSADIDVYSEAIDKKNGDEERRSRLDRWSNLDGGDRREERRQPGNDGSRSDGKPFKIEWRDNLFGGERRTVEFRKDDPRPSFAALYERAQPEYEQAFRSLLTKSPHHLGETERRALQADSQTDGGYLVPTQFVARLIKFVDDMLFIRQFGTVFPLATGDSVGFPSLDTDPADFDWTTELQTGSEDSTMAFGKRELAPHPLAKRIKRAADQAVGFLVQGGGGNPAQRFVIEVGHARVHIEIFDHFEDFYRGARQNGEADTGVFLIKAGGQTRRPRQRSGDHSDPDMA